MPAPFPFGPWRFGAVFHEWKAGDAGWPAWVGHRRLLGATGREEKRCIAASPWCVGRRPRTERFFTLLSLWRRRRAGRGVHSRSSKCPKLIRLRGFASSPVWRGSAAFAGAELIRRTLLALLKSASAARGSTLDHIASASLNIANAFLAEATRALSVRFRRVRENTPKKSSARFTALIPHAAKERFRVGPSGEFGTYRLRRAREGAGRHGRQG